MIKIREREGEHPYVSYIRARIKKNKNFLALISGETGSGKSYSALSVCAMVDPDFNTSQIVFTGMQLMELINSGTLKTGSAILFDEVGVGISNRNWQSVTNKMLNFLLQTFRHRNFILIFTSPHIDFIDAASRKLFHAELETAGIDRNKAVCKLRPKNVSYNAHVKKFYRTYLRVETKRGVFPLKIWPVKKPSKELLKEYENVKAKYTKNLNKDIMTALNKMEKSQQKSLELECLDCNYVWEGKRIPGCCPSCNTRSKKKKGIRIINEIKPE